MKYIAYEQFTKYNANFNHISVVTKRIGGQLHTSYFDGNVCISYCNTVAEFNTYIICFGGFSASFGFQYQVSAIETPVKSQIMTASAI